VQKERVDQLRAVEALRAGVPNRDVVRQLPPLQDEIEERFQSLLEATDAGWMETKQAPGLLLEGDFGTGKSHWLEYFRHVALESRFICSTVVVNKETPLYDLTKLYRACAESAVAPDKNGPALAEIPTAYQAEKAPGYRELFEWVHQQKELDPRFAATLFLFERSADPELRQRIVEEWIGDAMRVSDLKAALRQLGEPQTYAISRPARGQALLRFEFFSRFFASAGYAGWVILLDEAEMISKYSLRQRGKAYAHLAQLLGQAKGVRVPGLATVATITKDYAGEVLYGRKNDIVNIPARLENTRDAEFAAPAESGMRVIKSKALELRPPTRDQVHETYQKVRALYSNAYAWDAPDIGNPREYSSSTGMRQYVRSWITVWDLRRLYNYQADLIAERAEISYEEDADLQTEPREDEDPTISL
jgi:bacteriophage exclusion system BrxC/D-like protein